MELIDSLTPAPATACVGCWCFARGLDHHRH